MSDIKISPRLAALLIHVKKQNDWNGWHTIADALGELYSPNMKLRDAVYHAVRAYEEVLNEPRFEIGSSSVKWEELLLAPLIGPSSIDFLGPASLNTSYTVEQFYNSMIMMIMGQLTITRIDWCRDQLSSYDASF